MKTIILSVCVVILSASAVANSSKVETVRGVLDELNIESVKQDDIKELIPEVVTEWETPKSLEDLGSLVNKVLTKLIGTDEEMNTSNVTDGLNKEQQKEGGEDNQHESNGDPANGNSKRATDENSRRERGVGVCLRLDIAGFGELVDGFLGANGLTQHFLTLLNLPRKIIEFILGLPFSFLKSLPLFNLIPGLGGLLGNGGLLGGLLGGKDGGLLGGILGGKDGGILGNPLGGLGGGLLGGGLGNKGSGLLGNPLSNSGGLLGGVLGGGASQQTSTTTSNKSSQPLLSLSGGGLLGIGRRSADEDSDSHVKKRFLLLDSVQLFVEFVSFVYGAVSNLIKEILIVGMAKSLLEPYLGGFLRGLPFSGQMQELLNGVMLGNLWPLRVVSRSLGDTGVHKDLASFRVNADTHDETDDDGFLLSWSIEYDNKPTKGLLSSLTGGILGLELWGFPLSLDSGLAGGLTGGITHGLKQSVPDIVGGGLVSGIVNKTNDLVNVIGVGGSKSSLLNNDFINTATDLQNSAIESSKLATNALNSIIKAPTNILVNVDEPVKTQVGSGLLTEGLFNPLSGKTDSSTVKTSGLLGGFLNGVTPKTTVTSKDKGFFLGK